MAKSGGTGLRMVDGDVVEVVGAGVVDGRVPVDALVSFFELLQAPTVQVTTMMITTILRTGRA